MPASAHAAPLQFFTETAHPELDPLGATAATPLVGDFNGDGTSDVFSYRPGAGAETILYGSGTRTGFVAAQSNTFSVKGTYQPLVGDFDGDGISDIFWYAPGPAADSLWRFSLGGGHTTNAKSVTGTYQPFVGDFTSDDGLGTDDIFWYGPGSTADSIWKGEAGGAFTSIPQAISGTYTPLVGSFTPDPGTGGSTDPSLDVFWYAPGATADSLWRGDGDGHFSPKAYNVGGTYKPFVGFFDGFGVQDIFWYSPTGTDSVWLADPDTQQFTSHPTSIGSGFTPITDEFTIPDEPIYWWSTASTDRFWLPEGEPGTWEYSELSNNTDMGSGYRPLTGDFDGDTHRDILWLATGASTDTSIWWGPG
ncbi:MAG: hypothetical protein JWO77_381 [Ilumatobacteraceae bacterium]|nr:hypothetical protein [Ilumatobacteraceae bacterium]